MLFLQQSYWERKTFVGTQNYICFAAKYREQLKFKYV